MIDPMEDRFYDILEKLVEANNQLADAMGAFTARQNELAAALSALVVYAEEADEGEGEEAEEAEEEGPPDDDEPALPGGWSPPPVCCATCYSFIGEARLCAKFQQVPPEAIQVQGCSEWVVRPALAHPQHSVPAAAAPAPEPEPEPEPAPAPKGKGRKGKAKPSATGDDSGMPPF